MGNLVAALGAGRARSVTSGHRTLPFRRVALANLDLPAEPSPSATTAAPEATTQTPADSLTEPTHGPWPSAAVRRRIAIRDHRSGVRRCGIRPERRPGAKSPNRRRIHVAWDRKPSTVSGRPTRHRPQPKRPCSIACRHCYHLPCVFKSPITTLCGDHLTWESCSSAASSVSGTKLPTPPATARHPEGILLQLAANEGRQHLLDIAAGLRDHLDAACRQGPLQRPGDCATDQHARSVAGQQARPSLRSVRFDGDVPAGLFLPVGDVHQQHVAGHVEDRADPALIGDRRIRRTALGIVHFDFTLAV